MLRLINHRSLFISGKCIHFELDGRYYLCVTQYKGLDNIIQCVILPSNKEGSIQCEDRLYEEDYVYNTWEQLNKAIIKFAYVMTGVTYNIKSFTFIDWLNELIFHKITAIKPCIATEKDIDKDIEQRIKGYCRKEILNGKIGKFFLLLALLSYLNKRKPIIWVRSILKIFSLV